jgi:hypothetical protein
MNKELEFLRLIDIAIDACQRAVNEGRTNGKAWMVEDASATRSQFEKIARQVQANELAPSQGAGLGITRSLSEWAPDYLYSAGEAVEDFYMTSW